MTQRGGICQGGNGTGSQDAEVIDTSIDAPTDAAVDAVTDAAVD